MARASASSGEVLISPLPEGEYVVGVSRQGVRARVTVGADGGSVTIED